MQTRMEQNNSTESLVRSARSGDGAAFKTLYERYYQLVFRTAYRLLGERMSAEDMTQEVFIKIHRKLHSFDFNASFQTWCYRITVNTCYDIMRKQKRRGQFNKGSVEPDFYESKLQSSKGSEPEENLNRTVLSEIIEDKLQAMHEDLKTAFVLREFEQLSYSDIANVMECSEGTVASRLARARSQLANYLTRIGIDHSYFN